MITGPICKQCPKKLLSSYIIACYILQTVSFGTIGLLNDFKEDKFYELQRYTLGPTIQNFKNKRIGRIISDEEKRSISQYTTWNSEIQGC